MKLENCQSLPNQISRYRYFKSEGFIVDEKVYTDYYELIKKISDLFDKLGFDNCIKVSAIYSVLLWKGLFSVNHRFKFQRYEKYNNSYLPGFNVMSGGGACFNTAAMLKDILIEMGYESYMLVCRIDPKEEDTRVEKISPRNMMKTTPTISERIDGVIGDIFKKPNHAITGIIKDGRLYIADSINQDFAYLNKELNARYVFRRLDAKIDQKQTILVNQKMDNDDLKRLFVDSLSTSRKLSKEKLEELYEDIIKYYKENKEGFDLFYESIIDDINKISKEYQKIKRMH